MRYTDMYIYMRYVCIYIYMVGEDMLFPPTRENRHLLAVFDVLMGLFKTGL